MARYVGAATALVVACTAAYAWAQQPQMSYKDAHEFVLKQLEQGCQNEFRQSVEIKRASDRRFGMVRSEQELLTSARYVGMLVTATASEANRAYNDALANADLDGPFAACVWKRRVEQIANNGGVTPPWPRVGDVAVKTTVAAPPAPAPAPAPAPVSNSAVEAGDTVLSPDGRECITANGITGRPNGGQIKHTWTFNNLASCPAVWVKIYYGTSSLPSGVIVQPGKSAEWWCLEGPDVTSNQCIGGNIQTTEQVAP